MGQSGKSFRNCYLGLGFIWQVKMYLGGEQRIVGETFHCFRAVRFADMALLHFAKYRKRRARATVDSDLNFSVASAQRDLDAVPAAKQILVSLETGLQARGLLPTDPALVEHVDKRDCAQVCRDLRLFFRQYRLTVSRATTLVGSHPEAQITLAMMSDNMTQLETLNRSLDKTLHIVNTTTQ
jgi:hypothetical protein